MGLLPTTGTQDNYYKKKLSKTIAQMTTKFIQKVPQVLTISCAWFVYYVIIRFLFYVQLD